MTVPDVNHGADGKQVMILRRVAFDGIFMADRRRKVTEEQG